MMRKFCILLGVSLLLSSCRLSSQLHDDQVCFGKTCVNVEVVSTPEAMEKGLMNRTSLPEDAGMLFVFPQPDRYLFWMKDTLIPLDMVWMNQDRQIIHIRKQVPPCKADPCDTYGPLSRNAVYVLEVNSGYCQKKGLKEGDRADFFLK